MFSLVKHLGKYLLAWQIQAWHWSPPVISLQASSMAWRRRTCLWGAYCEPSTSMWRKTPQWGYSQERRVWGWIQADKRWMGLKPWLLSVPSLGILGTLNWFCYRAPQNHIQWGVFGPPANIVLGRSQPLGSQPACLIQKYEWFSSASSSITL